MQIEARSREKRRFNYDWRNHFLCKVECALCSSVYGNVLYIINGKRITVLKCRGNHYQKENNLVLTNEEIENVFIDELNKQVENKKKIIGDLITNQAN